MKYVLFLRSIAVLLLGLWAAGAQAQSGSTSPRVIRKYKLKTTTSAHPATRPLGTDTMRSARPSSHRLPPRLSTSMPPPLPPPATSMPPPSPPPTAGHNVPYAATISRPAKPNNGFPWPPRPYSEQINLPQEFFAGVHTLGEADDHLSQVLAQASYREPRYYVLPQQPGFALVTKFEQIKETYAPMPEPARWSLDTTPCPGFSPLCLARSLVFPTSGYWRVFVFVVTDRPLPGTEGTAPSSEEAEQWFSEGTNKLPAAVRKLPFTADHYAAVLVYEFNKREGQPVVLVPRCRRDGFTQLQLVGIQY